MSDSTYQPKVYRKNGGDTTVVASGGLIQVEPGGEISLITPRKGVYYVDQTNGLAANDGLSWAGAKKTIASAVALAVAGDTIYIWSDGTSANQFNEAVTVAVAGLRIIGAGTNPNQALWSAPDTTAPCLTIAAAADCVVENIRFRPPVANAAISLTGASHNARIQGCRFQGKTNSYYGIETDGSQSNVHILDNEFFYINTATFGTAIKGTGYVSSDPTGWTIEGNKFHSNLNHIVCAMRQSVIRKNLFAGVGISPAGAGQLTVVGIDLSGGSSGVGANIVTRNDIGGLYHLACYKPAIATVGAAGSDEWSGNYCADRTHATQVDATTGISILAPVT